VPIASQEELERIADAGYAIYNEKLKSILEPTHNGQVVAIHLDSGDYEVARNSPLAWKALQKRHAEGLMAILHIGPPKFDPMMSRTYGPHTETAPNGAIARTRADFARIRATTPAPEPITDEEAQRRRHALNALVAESERLGLYT
jgi:hypothetical protein